MKKNVLGHRNISNSELPLLAKTIQYDTNDKDATLKQLSLIDDLLDIKKMELLLTAPKYTKTGRLRLNQRRQLHEFIEDRVNIDLSS
ncbi:MAG: hypothetical protein U9N85_01170 [Bacteroidota bacterium]|nr:hypothetical protein [Bacteroidota bacterium]